MKPSLQQTTAILVFANSSREELKYKPFAKNGVLFDELTQHTLQTVEKTKLPYFHFTEQQQIGTTFGERFTHAIQTIFDKGYDNVITLGNDTPQLKTSHILEAHGHISAGKPVLGPSVDGGFYLMALKKSCFDAFRFKGLSWQTNTLYSEISLLLENAGFDIFSLSVLRDLDTIRDAKSLLNHMTSISLGLFRVLTAIFSIKKIRVVRSLCFTGTQDYCIHFNKGSPSLLLF
ncbi:MAG: DUF2064 domain-containing protein [Saonia sp.]